MANTSARTLRLLTLLQSRRYWPGPLLADRLEVSPRTLRRDIDRLRELGYPVDAQPGVDGGYALAAGTALPPLVVDDDEAMALAVAVQTHLASGGVGAGSDRPGSDGNGDAALRALTKIVQVMPRRLRTRLDAVRAATTGGPWGGSPATRLDYDVLSVLALGCRDRERVRFGYRAADRTTSSRHVEPLRLVPLGTRWYLVGFDLDRLDWRTFRIDRISEASGTGIPFGPRRPPFDDVVAWVRGKVGAGTPGGRHRVVVRVQASAATVSARFGGWAQVDPTGPEQCLLTMDADTLDGPLIALGLVGAEFSVESPPELADLARAWGALFTRSAAAGPPRASAEL